MALWPLALLVSGYAGQADASLPPTVHPQWAVDLAWTQKTPTRQRICLNGLWRWQPGTDTLPTGSWGWFKVPGCWPGIGDYMQKDCQTVFTHSAWAKENIGRLTSAWYQREITVPANWSGRRISIKAAYVNSLATVFVDGKQAGAISFPGGELDLTKFARAGTKHSLTMQVVALPLKAVMLSYSDTNAAKLMKATVERRGLCGDVFLESSPLKSRIDDVQVQTSVRKWNVTVGATTSNFDRTKKVRLKVRVLDHGVLVDTHTSEPMAPTSNLKFTYPWHPGKLWDIHTPQNQYDLELSLLDSSGKVLDVQPPKRFGFRELWIKGKDFVLNNKRIFWSCVPLDNAAVSAGLASYEGAKESLSRLKSFGINMVYTHNYDCKPGSNLSFDEILRAADDVGILVALTQPHFADYDWAAPGAGQNNGYARHAAYFASVAGSHPSVIAYATSHNATGYAEATNPDHIDGSYEVRDSWAFSNMKKALRAQAIIQKVDPSRIVYHHSSGNLGSMHTMNFYLNFVPIQEMSDWYEHWSTVGVKPAFMVEYGVPFSWDWSTYRGWYNGERSFGSAQVPWEYTMAEWNSQFLGDQAYAVSEAEKRNIRWEANKFKTSKGWFRWDYPYPMGSNHPDFEIQQEVWARYTIDNWRAFRTWGVSGISPWETYGLFWRLKDGVNRGRVELKTDWDHLQRPGYSPDYIDGRYERRDLAYKESDWVPTTGGKGLIAANGEVLAYIGGKPGAFTDKSHNFHAGEVFEKQSILVNNSREPQQWVLSWIFGSGIEATSASGNQVPKVQAPGPFMPGTINSSPLKLKVSSHLPAGEYRVSIAYSVVKKEASMGVDEFKINVLPPTPRVAAIRNLGVYDPAGETTTLLASLGLSGRSVKENADLQGLDVLIVGKGALTIEGGGLDLARVRTGLKVVVFEQSSEVLEKRFGFRVQEYGLRNVFERLMHPILNGLTDDHLRDWRGESTIVPHQRDYKISSEYNMVPAIMRNGILTPEVWRAGNRGNVASVLIEKPAVGDFLPILDGGYSLQYSPLMEYHEGKGMVMFCQMDVTGRTEGDPAADRLTANLLNYVAAWRPSPEKSISYVGDPAGKNHLELAGFRLSDVKSTSEANTVLVVGPGADMSGGLPGFGTVLGVGLSQSEVDRWMRFHPPMETREYINSRLQPAPFNSPFAGIASADVFNRDPRSLAVFKGNSGVLNVAPDGREILFQLAPWTFDKSVMNTKRVFRHTSFALSRLVGNLGVHAQTPLLERFGAPVKPGEQRWLTGFYLDTPVLEDDPYRFFGW